MKVTVIVPIYNSAKYLDESIGSLLKQTYEDLEILLVDNGSADNSLDICNSYAVKDKRIRVLHTDENIGTGAARNLGLENALGEYICFFDADDRYEPLFVEKLLSAATEKENPKAESTYLSLHLSNSCSAIFSRPESVLLPLPRSQPRLPSILWSTLNLQSS